MSSEETLKPYTVSAVYDDGLEAVIKHCVAADPQAARDQVIMETGGRVIIASVFEGHLDEPDAVVFHVRQDTESDDTLSEEDAESVQV
jgi:hypothetical protein